METKRLINLDDVCYTLEISDLIGKETIKFSGMYEYNEVVGCILTEKQYECYIGDFIREFEVSEKKIQEVKEYLKISIWRK